MVVQLTYVVCILVSAKYFSEWRARSIHCSQRAPWQQQSRIDELHHHVGARYFSLKSSKFSLILAKNT